MHQRLAEYKAVCDAIQAASIAAGDAYDGCMQARSLAGAMPVGTGSGMLWLAVNGCIESCWSAKRAAEDLSRACTAEYERMLAQATARGEVTPGEEVDE